MYREVTCLLHSHLGKDVHRQLLVCVEQAIHEAFPKSDGEEYVGFSHGEANND